MRLSESEAGYPWTRVPCGINSSNRARSLRRQLGEHLAGKVSDN